MPEPPADPFGNVAGGLFLVCWDREVHRVWGFAKAKEFLLNELMWLWEDFDDAVAAQAFDAVCGWDIDGPWPQRIRAGVPPTWYEMRMVG